MGFTSLAELKNLLAEEPGGNILGAIYRETPTCFEATVTGVSQRSYHGTLPKTEAVEMFLQEKNWKRA